MYHVINAKLSFQLLHCNRAPFNRINWGDEPSGYAENPDNWSVFLNKQHWQFEVKKKLQTDVVGYTFIYVERKYYYVISYV
jgi:hypothetical protein